MVRLSNVATRTPLIMGSLGLGRHLEASDMNFATHDSDKSAPFITNAMES